MAISTSTIVLATMNEGKTAEIRGLLGEQFGNLVSLNEFSSQKPIRETGTTFQENALIKARKAWERTGLTSLADDSGLVVDYLNGEPGIFSARFAGPKADDRQNNARLLKLMRGVPEKDRTARFHCTVALKSALYEHTVDSEVEGVILEDFRGSHGFGYDPLFYYPPLGKTFAELSQREKNRISHRGKAFLSMAKWMKEMDFGA